MPASLLASQLETLQPLAGDEPGIAIDVTDSPEAVADAAVAAIGRLPARGGAHRCGGARSSSGT
jgi:gluconokinase